MKFLISIFTLVSIVLADPSWISKTDKLDGKNAAVGMAEFHFPVHVQERVALMRAKAKLTETSNTHSGFEIREKFIDADGNLYLLVVSQ